MNFVRKVQNSIYSPEFYKSLPGSPIGSAFKYFFMLILIVQLISVARIAPEFLFTLSGKIRSSVASVKDLYPKELTVTIKSGEVSTNVTEPYFLKDKSGNNFAVIDTKTPYSAAKFNDYGVWAWITKDTIFYKGDSKGQIKSQNLDGIGNATIDKNFINTLADKLTPKIPFIGPILLVLVFIGLYLGAMFRLTYLFFLALPIMLLTKIIKKGLSYGQSYKVGIYATTLGLLVDMARGLFGIPGFPFMFTLISLVVVAVNFRKSSPVQ